MIGKWCCAAIPLFGGFWKKLDFDARVKAKPRQGADALAGVKKFQTSVSVK
jgi:hypothetical protein